MEGSNQPAEQQQQQQQLLPETENCGETSHQQAAPANSVAQPQQQELSSAPLTSSVTEGEVKAQTVDVSSENKSDDVPASTSQVEQPATETKTSEEAPVAVVRELTAVDKLNEHENGLLPAAAATVAVPTNGIHRITPHEMEMAELKVRIACHEKNNMALKMELKCAELQVAAKEKLDAKKTRLIELLDNKVTAVEKKNTRLIEMMEQMVRDKDSHSHRLIDATKNMEELARRLSDSERARQELRKVNIELKTMLDSVEGKGSQIAKLAKEKVLKYKEQNERMQKELDNLKGGSDGVAATGFLAEGGNENTADNPTAATSVTTEDNGFSQIEKLCHQLESVVVGNEQETERSSDSLRSALADVGRITGELKSVMLHLQESTTAGEQKAATARAANEKSLKEEINSKDREIALLKEELARLKSAIGQLVGLNLTAAIIPAAAQAVPSEPVAPTTE